MDDHRKPSLRRGRVLWVLLSGVGAGGEAAARQGGMSFLDPPAPPELVPGPMWERLLFESPWALVVLLGAAALVVFALMRRQGRAGRGGALAGVLLALGAGLYLLSATVETARERITADTVALVAAAARADAAGVGAILTGDAEMYPPAGGGALDRDRILARVRDDLGGRWRIKDWAVLEVQAQASGVLGRTQVKVRVVPEATGFPSLSWWRLDWKQDASGRWRAWAIEPVSLTPEVERELR